MFTGLVENLGKVKYIQRIGKILRLYIQTEKLNLKIGDSIAVNGVCLTITNLQKDGFIVEVIPETQVKTNLKYLKVGNKINLESALKIGDSLGGHFVQGHIDGLGILKKKVKEGDSFYLEISPPRELLKYIISKGSIAIEGISLTVAKVENNSFGVFIIPHTAKMTNLKDKLVGDKLNLEVDFLAKYTENFLKER